MKSTLFASTVAAALTATSFGQVEVYAVSDCCFPWDTNWDGTTLSFYQPFDCSGATIWDFWVFEETTVTYQLEWLSCEGIPDVYSPFGFVGPFATIEADWDDQGGPTTWSGTFTLEPGFYDRIYFLEFQIQYLFQLQDRYKDLKYHRHKAVCSSAYLLLLKNPFAEFLASVL